MIEHAEGCPSPYDYCTCGAPGSLMSRRDVERAERAYQRGLTEGRQLERAAIVAKLRRSEQTYDAIADRIGEGEKGYDYNVGRMHGYQHAAEYVERADHLRPDIKDGEGETP